MFLSFVYQDDPHKHMSTWIFKVILFQQPPLCQLQFKYLMSMISTFALIWVKCYMS